MGKKYTNLLTLALTGRNDNYNPFFVSRLKYCLEYASYCLKRIKKKNFLRFSVCDWGSEINLKNSLNLDKNTSSIVDFHEVEERFTKKIGDSNNRMFSTAIAHNVALRRANSKFLGYTSHDYIMNESFFENLYNFLTGNGYRDLKLDDSFIVIPRKHLPEQLFLKKPSFSYLSRWILRSGEVIGEHGSKHGGDGGAYITSNYAWSKIGGIEERFSGWGVIEYELFLRANYLGNWYDSSKFGVWQYKLPRGNAPVRNKVLEKNLNKNWFSLKVNPNGAFWGLSKLKVNTFSKTKYLQKENRNFNLILDPLKNYKKISSFNLISNISKLFNTPVQIRFKFISINEIRLMIIIKNIFKNTHLRSVNFIGFSNCFLPGFLAIFSPSIELHIIDDIKKTLKFNSKVKDYIIGSKVYERLILLSSFLKKVNHLGYFRPLSGNLSNNIEIFFKDFPKENYSNLLIVKSKILNNNDFNKFKKLVNKDIKNIDLIILEDCNSLMNNKIESLNKKFEVKKHFNNKILFNKKKYFSNKKSEIEKITNTGPVFLLFLFVNIYYYITFFKRFIINRILKKFIF